MWQNVAEYGRIWQNVAEYGRMWHFVLECGRIWYNNNNNNNIFALSKSLKVPIKPMLKCKGFTYSASKLYNLLPMIIKKAKNPNTFKNLTKQWIQKNIPSR